MNTARCGVAYAGRGQ